MDALEKNIVLIGMRGSGKTVVGTMLASRLHRDLIPMDALIVYEAELSIPEIVEQFGWPRFREIEAHVAQKVARLRGTVNATGGGVILNPNNVDALRSSGIVFWLNVSVENTLRRIGEDPNRPSLTGNASRRDDMLATFTEREPMYRAAAHHIIDTDDKYPRHVTDEILGILQRQYGFDV